MHAPTDGGSTLDGSFGPLIMIVRLALLWGESKPAGSSAIHVYRYFWSCLIVSLALSDDHDGRMLATNDLNVDAGQQTEQRQVGIVNSRAERRYVWLDIDDQYALHWGSVTS